MTYSIRLVVRELGGNAGVIVHSWSLKAQVLAEAKAEVDKGHWTIPGITANAVEIIGSDRTVVAHRPYAGGRTSIPWS